MGKAVNIGLGVVLVSMAVSVAGSAPAGARPGEAVIHELASAPLFAFMSWDKKARPAAGGLHIQAPDGRGGAGYALQADLSAFAERALTLTVAVGPGNKAASLLVVIQDADGTGHQYVFA